MRLSHALVSLPLLALLAGAPTAAFAGKKAPDAGASAAAEEPPLPKIEPTGISEFDDVFLKARAIHDTIDQQNTALKDAKVGVNKAAKVADGEPLDTALAAIKSGANGQIQLNTSGATPRVQPKDGAPADVQTSCTAINKLLEAAEMTQNTVKEIKPEATRLADAAAGFPAKLLDMKLEPTKLLEARKKVTNDVKATGATPDRVDRLGKSTEDVFTSVKNAFTE